MVGSRLRSGVGAVRGERSRFGERRVVGPERAEHLVGRNVQESEVLASRRRLPFQPYPSFLEQGEGAEDIGLNELSGPVNGTIDVAFRGEVNDGARRVSFEEAPHQLPIADIPVDEHVRRVVLERLEIRRVARVGELVQVDDRVRPLREPIQDKIRTYEAGTTCDQNGHSEARSSAFSFAYLLKLFMHPIVTCTKPGTPSRKPSRHR